ncbi:hypothetical protein HAALTHF_54560n [Vreelandella aquamarina]|nr:hypothetical protein HAALTHF_54560n [Halomonas axialensis]
MANQDGTGHSVFSAEESGMNDFGIFIENRALQYALWQRLEELPSVTCYTQCAPLSTMAATTARMLELDNGKTLSARLIVGADGARSTLRELAGIGVTSHDYHQRAMIINVETELPQQDVSWQCFTPKGRLPCCRCPASAPRWCGTTAMKPPKPANSSPTTRSSTPLKPPSPTPGQAHPYCGAGQLPH